MKEKCPKCHSLIQRTFVIVPAHSLDSIPRQTEPYVKIVKWQCLRNPGHHGTYMEPSRAVETGETEASIPVQEWTDDEWLQVLREFPPDADFREAEKKVAEWRLSKTT
jgi:hypothetical protein